MKVKIFAFFLILLNSQIIYSQNKLSETEKLESLCKVWGFLKYYHPNVANGTYNWDQELFKILPKVEEATDKNTLSNVYINWISSLGEIPECKSCSTANENYFNENFDLKWTENKNIFSNTVIKKLKEIENNRNQEDNFYVTSAKNIENALIQNEPEYSKFDWKDKNMRLLSLFRYWNFIEYFFPYKYQTDENWNSTLKNLLPKFVNAQSEQDYNLANLEMISKIDDSHAYYITWQTNNYFGFKWLPIKFELINDVAVISGFYDKQLAEKDDLKIGDIITKVDGKTINEIFNEKKKFINGSNILQKKRNSRYAIFNGGSDSIKISFLRNNKETEKIVHRFLFKDFKQEAKENKPKYKILPQNIGYVNMGILEKKDVSKMMDSLMNTKAIIFDIRNYPKGTNYLISNYISSKENEFFKVIVPDLKYPGKFIWKDGDKKSGKNGQLQYKGKVVLLVDEKTQSHAEFTTMTLQTGDNVTTIGRQTSGADGNVTRFKTVDNIDTMFTGIGIFYPDKSITQRVGVKIDIQVPKTIEAVEKQKDEILERAITFIETGK
ncbi:S41 family peptidase [Riemerella anatipestifer]|nr:S41 family peptidase [Riemerella anatipestifer]